MKNIGNFGRILRVLIAALIGVLYFTQVISGTLGIILLVVGGVLISTALIGFCPLYYVLGIKTCESKQPK